MPLDQAVIDAYMNLDAATVYEAVGKTGDLPHQIRPIIDGAKLVGPAYTVRCWPGDGTAFLRAVEEAEPGDVLVIDSGAGAEATTWGGSATLRAQYRGLAGIVTNGCVRDVRTIRQAGFPVFAAGICVRGVAVGQSGWINVPVCIGSTVISPGDLILGDVDGIVVVPRRDVDRVLAKSLEQKQIEDDFDEKLSTGAASIDISKYLRNTNL